MILFLSTCLCSHFVLLEVFTAVFLNIHGIVGYYTVPVGTGAEQDIPSTETQSTMVSIIIYSW
jgi:hypothetical protein